MEIFIFVHKTYRSRDSWVGIGTRLLAGRLGFDSRQVQEIFLYVTSSIPALKPIQSPIHLVPDAKRPGRECDQSPPTSAEVENDGAIPPLPHTRFHK
jgi:hypothetical protein